MCCMVLDGIRVIELASGMAGELPGLILAQYGAEVIKIESPGGGRSTEWDGYRLRNVGKQRLAIDLTTPEGAEQLHDLARTAVVVVQALRPDAAAKLGVDADAMLRLNPNLIYCSITGFDPGTPWADFPGWEGWWPRSWGVDPCFKIR